MNSLNCTVTVTLKKELPNEFVYVKWLDIEWNTKRHGNLPWPST